MMGGFFAPTATTSWTAPDVVATEEEGLGAAINDPGVTTTAMSSFSFCRRRTDGSTPYIVGDGVVPS